MVGKLDINAGDDYAFDIRAARAHAEGAVVVVGMQPGETRGPWPTGGAPFWLRRNARGTWQIGFDIDKDPDADIWVNLTAFMKDADVTPGYQAEVTVVARRNGWAS